MKITVKIHELARKLAENDGEDWPELSDEDVERYYEAARERLAAPTTPGASEDRDG